MPYKFTMLFNVPNGGFSESWYWDASVALPVSGAGNPFDDLFQVRCGLLAQQAEPLGWRLSDIDNPRLSQLSLFPKTAQIQAATDVPTTAWLVLCKGTNNVGRRQLWIRGCPDDSVAWSSAGNRFTRDPKFDEALQLYGNVLKAANNRWSIRHVLSKKEQAASTYSVSAISPSLTVAATTLTAVAIINPLTPLIVGGFKKPLNKLNGTYLPDSGFKVVDSGVQLIGKVIPTVQANGYPGGATIRNQGTLLVKVTDFVPEFARSRQVGRGFFLLRGTR